MLAVGSFNPFNVKTEIYLSEVDRWFELDDYPYD